MNLFHNASSLTNANSTVEHMWQLGTARIATSKRININGDLRVWSQSSPNIGYKTYASIFRANSIHMASSLFSLSPAPLSHTNSQCPALCTELDTIECAMRRAFGCTADCSHAGMHNRARGHASFMLTCTRSLRYWRKCQKHHTFVNHTCDKRHNGTCQSADRLAEGVRGFVRIAIVCDKVQNDVEPLCSRMTAAATLLAIPVASQRPHHILKAAHQSTICSPRRRMRRRLHRRPPRPGLPARASAPSWRVLKR